MPDHEEERTTEETAIEEHPEEITFSIKSTNMDYYEEDRKYKELTIRYEDTCFGDVSHSIKRISKNIQKTLGHLPNIIKDIKAKDKDMIMLDEKEVITKEEAENFVSAQMHEFYISMKNAGYELEPIPEEDSEKELHDYFIKKLKKKYIVEE